MAWNAYGAGPDEILWRHQAGVGYLRYHTDMHGNVTALLDGSGNVIEQYSYDAFGQATITDRYGNADSRWDASSSVGNHFMFQGREYFSEIGLYDFRHRFYDPTFGHFLQSDPLGFGGGDANLFRYCGGDPVNGRDPTGLWTLQWGYSFNYQIGPFSGAIGGGIAFDGQGNVALYRSYFGGGGGPIGADVDLAEGGMWSAADSIYDLRGPFLEQSATGGDEIAGTAVHFSGNARNGDAFDGYGFFIGAGAGLGATAGTSTTMVSGVNIFTGKFDIDPEDMPAPGGTTNIDPNICPGCPTLERVTVTSNYLPSTPSLDSFHVNPTTFFSPGYGSGLNPGSNGGASAAAVQSTIFQTLFGIPGGGPLPGEGTHPVSYELE